MNIFTSTSPLGRVTFKGQGDNWILCPRHAKSVDVAASIRRLPGTVRGSPITVDRRQRLVQISQVRGPARGGRTTREASSHAAIIGWSGRGIEAALRPSEGAGRSGRRQTLPDPALPWWSQAGAEPGCRPDPGLDLQLTACSTCQCKMMELVDPLPPDLPLRCADDAARLAAANSPEIRAQQSIVMRKRRKIARMDYLLTSM